MRVFTYHKSVLPSGLRVVTEEIPHVRSVSIGIWMGVGSRHETDDQAGISHFIEHLLFKGTEKRSAREVAETMDAIGGHLNAFTGKEYTCYYAKVLDEHFDTAVDLLSDLVLHAKLDPADVEKERNVILEEIMMYEDSPEELSHDMFAQAIWPGSSLGRPIQGSVDTVQKITPYNIQGFYRQHYLPGNTVIAVSGNVSHERVVEEVARRFPEGNGLGHEGGSAALDQVIKASPQNVLREKDIEQVHICIGAEGLSLRDERLYELHLLNNILGGGTSSRLFQEVREERGLAYSVYAFNSSYRDAGMVAVYLASGPGTVGEALEVVRKELSRFPQEGVKPEELARCKDQVKAGLLLSLENTSSRMTHLGKGELLKGEILSPDEIIDRVERVTEEDIVALAAEMWDEGRLGLAAVGPIGKAAADLTLEGRNGKTV